MKKLPNFCNSAITHSVTNGVTLANKQSIKHCFISILLRTEKLIKFVSQITS